MNRIAKKKQLTPVTTLFEVDAPMVARKARPGQFVVVRISEKGERIPLTIADFDRERGTVTIVVQEVGKTTREMARLREGDEILDFLGPLGQPAELLTGGRVICVGGGFGVAPVLPIAKALNQRGVEVISVIGARTKDLLILEEELRAVSKEFHVATDDGSRGHKGLVTEVLKMLLDRGQPVDRVVAIGPMVMMRAVAEVTRPYGVKTLVSVDPIMVDGTGMCGCCRVTVDGKVRFACVDGPIFDAHQVDFNEAVRRGRIYAPEQKLALERCTSCGGEG